MGPLSKVRGNAGAELPHPLPADSLMERKGSFVFVSTELHPYTGTDGEMGRELFDMLRSLPAGDRERTTLCLVDSVVDPASFAATFPGVRMVLVETRVDQGRQSNGRQHPPARAYSTTPFHWRSAVVFRALAALAEETAIDYVEFPDRGALAFCTLQERNLSGFLADATIAVRLCTSHTQLMNVEAQVTAIEHLNLGDLERKCLRDCDRIVTSLLPIAEATRTSFGLPVEEWSARVIEHAPLAPAGPAAVVSVPASLSQRIVFPLALQRVNRPDLFVRAVCGFLSCTPGYTGTAVLGGPGADPAYTSDIERLIPAVHANRFERMLATQGSQREDLLRDATVVMAASWSSFCSLAYEASARGARLILNESNPAFGRGTPWEDGLNCLKFDGSAQGLLSALKRNIERNESLIPVARPVRPWPWSLPRTPRAAWRPLHEHPLVSIVVAHYNLGAYLAQTLESVRAQSYDNIEIVLVDDASTDLQSVQAVEALAGASDPGVKVLRLAGNVGLAAARNIGVRAAQGRYILTLDADDLIHPDFISVAIESLENRTEFDVIVTPAGYFHDADGLPVRGSSVDFVEYAMFSGEAMLGGLLENRFSTATAFFRKSALLRFPYLESLNCYEDWSLYLRMCEAGLRFIVTNDVYFYYRRRHNSMVHAPRAPGRSQLEYSDLMRTSAPESLKERSRHLIIGMASPVAAPSSDAARSAGNGSGASRIKGLFGAEGQYDEQVVFASLKLSRWLERRLPFLMRGTIWIASQIWAGYRALSGSRK